VDSEADNLTSIAVTLTNRTIIYDPLYESGSAGVSVALRGSTPFVIDK
jgi:hypothetical protein